MSEKPDLPGKADVPMAYRAICLVRALSSDAKSVAAVIIGYFNPRTGQCDPGTDTLMRRSGVSKRNVVNATNELDQLGLVVKIRHGGNGFRSRYQPNWKRFREIIEAYEKDEPEPEIVQKRALTKCKNVHLDSANSCTLTQLRNSSKKLKGTDGASGRVEPSKPAGTSAAVTAEMVNGLLRKSVRGPIHSTKSLPSVVSAQADAWTMIDRWLSSLSPTTREAIDGIWTPDVQQAAIIAEQKTRGAGRDLIMDRVARRSPAAGRH